MPTTAPALPPLDQIVALAGTDYEREFRPLELEPGLPYSVSRLDRIMFSARALLDADTFPWPSDEALLVR